MQTSRRIKRMSRGTFKKKVPGMNLVSLMDVFTILVFFLLVNSSNTEELPKPDILELPDSVSELKPEETIVVIVSETKILVKGKEIVSVADVIDDGEPIIRPISQFLKDEAKRFVGGSDKAILAAKGVTIMGDKKVPFRLLKKVMASCTAAGYERISLAVVQKASQAG